MPSSRNVGPSAPCAGTSATDGHRRVQPRRALRREHQWLSGNSLAQLYSKDLFAGLFFSIYGINDFLFVLFFAWVFFIQRNAQ